MLKIDHREQKIKDFCEKNKIECIFENLEIGDIQFCTKEGEIAFCFERKRLDDLLASIKDGRYKNQKVKTLSQLPHTKCYYIIEGMQQFSSSPSSTEKMIQSAIINTQLRDKIGCFQTKHVTETYELILAMFQRYKENPSKYDTPQQTEEQTIVSTSSKDDPIKIWKGMLCQIPGISEKSAQTIIEKWNNCKQLINELSPLTIKEQEAILNDLKNNNRRLGKKVTAGIIQHLL